MLVLETQAPSPLPYLSVSSVLFPTLPGEKNCRRKLRELVRNDEQIMSIFSLVEISYSHKIKRIFFSPARAAEAHEIRILCDNLWQGSTRPFGDQSRTEKNHEFLCGGNHVRGEKRARAKRSRRRSQQPQLDSRGGGKASNPKNGPCGEAAKREKNIEAFFYAIVDHFKTSECLLQFSNNAFC